MRHRNNVKITISAFFMACMILDTKTALMGAYEGLTMCMKILIPSLLPFIFLSMILTNSLAGKSSSLMSRLAAICHMEKGTESLLLVGLLGGYPVGAQNIAVCCKSKQISERQGERLLAFCNNAGPAFLFGIIGNSFSRPIYPWLLWLIHIISAIMVGLIYPYEKDKTKNIVHLQISTADAMQKAITAVLSVSGWVILFRTMLSFLDRWFLWALPLSVSVTISGILELANGCIQLGRIPVEGTRFVIASALLSCGGLCVAMQTISVSDGLSCRHYFSGKAMQTVFSVLISSLMCKVIFADLSTGCPLWIDLLLLIGGILFCCQIVRKNKSSIPIYSGI